jgi:hypothetical protein
VFLDSAIVGGEWSASSPGRFTSGIRALGIHSIGGLVDTRAGLDDVEKRKILPLPGLEFQSLGLPARSQSLYRLNYPGSFNGYIVDMWKMKLLLPMFGSRALV